MRIPGYEQQVQSEALPGVRAQLDYRGTNGEAVAQGLDQLAQGAGQLADAYLEAQRKAKATKLAQAKLQWQHDADTAMLGDKGGTDDGSGAAPSNTVVPNAAVPGGGAAAAQASGTLSPTGLLNAKGAAAAQYSIPTYRYLQKRQQEIAQGLGDEDLSKQFVLDTGPMLEAHRRTIEEHTAQQIQAEQIETTKNSMAAAIKGVAQNYNDPIQSGAMIASAEQDIRRLALDKADGDAKVQAFRSEVTSTMLDQALANKDTAGAQRIFSAQKDQLDAKSLDYYTKAIGGAQRLEAGDQQARELVAQNQDPDTGRHDLAKITGLLLDPKSNLTPEARRSLEHYASVAGDQDRQVSGNYWRAARDQYERNGQDASKVDAGLLTKMERFDPDAYAKFMAKAESDAKERLQPVRQKEADPTDAQKMREWNWEYLAATQPSRFKTMTPADLDKDLRDPKTGQLLVTHAQEGRLQNRLLELQGKKPTEPGAVSSAFKDRAIQAIARKFPSGKGSPAIDPGARGYAYNAIVGEIESEQRAGKKLTAEDVDRIAGEKLLEVPLKGTGFFGTNFDPDKVTVGQYEQDPGYRGKALVEAQPPPATIQAIRDQYAKKNIQITDAQAIDIYRRHEEKKAGVNEPAAPAPAPAATPPTAQRSPAHLTHPVNQAVLEATPPQRFEGSGMDAAIEQDRAAKAKAAAELAAAKSAADAQAARAKAKADTAERAQREREQIERDNRAARERELMTPPVDDFQRG